MQKTEPEIVALNIMKIRRRLGDKWSLTLEEYKAEREKDGGYSWAEESFFAEVIALIPDALGAIAFCKTLTDAARKGVAA